MVPTEFFAQQVKRYRVDRGWTQPQLADHCKAAGLDWDRSIVANVEGNRRSSITVHEVFTLAYVLKIPPAMLLFPLSTGEPIELIKGIPMQPGLALRWFVGEDDTDGQLNEYYRREAQPLLLYGELSRAYEAAWNDRINVNGQEAVHGADSRPAAAARERYVEQLANVQRILGRMDDIRMQPPPLDREVIEDAQRFGKPFPKSVPDRGTSNGKR